VHSNRYGAPKRFVDDQVERGEIVILEIDVQGALQVRELYPEAVLIFLIPPSLDELKRRIIKRGTETEDDMKIRLNNALKELKYVNKYYYAIINNELDDAIKRI